MTLVRLFGSPVPPKILAASPHRSSRTVLAAVLGIALAFVFPAATIAGDVGAWKSLGPLGSRGAVTAIAIDPISGAVYLAGRSGISKSLDGGASWSDASNGLVVRSVLTLVLDPSAPSVLYAGTDGSGIFKSIDAGASWFVLPGSPPSARALAIARLTSSALFAGTDGLGSFKSVDGGATWSALPELPIRSVTTLAVNPQASGTVYAGGSQEFGVPKDLAKSTDGGQTWRFLDTGPTLSDAIAVAVDPHTPATIYLAQLSDAGPALVRTTDGGDSWLSITDGLPFRFQPTALALDPQNPLTVYVAGGAHVFKSVNGGLSWSETSAGLTPAVDDGVPSYVFVLAIDPRNSNAIYAGTGGDGLFRSATDGASWARVTSGVFSDLRVSALATDPANPSTVYAAALDGVDQAEFLRSADGGLSWTNPGIPLSTLRIDAIVVDPVTPATLYLTTQGSGFLKSTDRGDTWAPANAGFPAPRNSFIYSLAIDPTSHTHLYAATDLGFFQSADGAATWSSWSVPPNFGTLLAIAPTSPPTFYAGRGDGVVFRSHDGGQTWVSLTTGLTGVVTAIVMDPMTPSTVYVAAGQSSALLGPPFFLQTKNGVARSADGGDTWTLVNGGLTNTSVHTLVADPRVPGRLFLATSSGVLASTNGGDGWFSIDDGLSSLGLEALAVDSSDAADVFAGTDSGVFRRSAVVTVPPCVAGAAVLCLNGGRYAVSATWATGSGSQTGNGQSFPLTADTGAFWFFSANNLELVVKVVDGRAFNGHVWVFAGALTDVAYTIQVTDSVTGEVRSYTNPAGQIASFADTAAF